MSADSPRRSIDVRGGGGGGSGGSAAGGNSPGVAALVPPQIVSDRSILDSAIGFISDVTLAHQPYTDPKDTILWARFETIADISNPRYTDTWEDAGHGAPPLLLVLGYGLGVQVWSIPADGRAVEVLAWRHGVVTVLRVLPTPLKTRYTREEEPEDLYVEHRPLMALVENSGNTSSGSSGTPPQYYAVNFVGLHTGAQVKTIKFKNPVYDVLANDVTIAITFQERIAIFDARTLEDRHTITTCYPSPGINPNPVALGDRWMAYAENRLLPSKRSGGGYDGELVASYTATVLNAAKSFGKGLRELGEHVAAGLTGNTSSGNTSKNSSFESNSGSDGKQGGVVTVIDARFTKLNKDCSKKTTASKVSMDETTVNCDPMVAHFVAHSDAIVSLEFDSSGLMLLTADRRGHNFHIFRIQPHPLGPASAAVEHLYVLHRGDTTAKVQNMSFSMDARWVAVSTLRGTTHVFPITPYGGAIGMRTHTAPQVVNKMSRFHSSAGLSLDGRSSSPISHSESTTFVLSLLPYANPTLPPYPRPTIVLPMAQLRQPPALSSPPGSAVPAASGKSSMAGSSSHRQRHSSLSDDSGKPLSVCALFARSRSHLLEPPNVTREAAFRTHQKVVDSLFVMAGHGALIQYDLDVKAVSNISKEKICDDTPIELFVEAKAQWNLSRNKEGSPEIVPPLSSENGLFNYPYKTMPVMQNPDPLNAWMSAVEITTHEGPHRRLWMGPQFVFKTYNAPSGSNLSQLDAEATEVSLPRHTPSGTGAHDECNMLQGAPARSTVALIIEAGSSGSIEYTPQLTDPYSQNPEISEARRQEHLREDLADAMRESPSSNASQRGGAGGISSGGDANTSGRSVPDIASACDNALFYDALAEHESESNEQYGSSATLAAALPNICSFQNIPLATTTTSSSPTATKASKAGSTTTTTTTLTGGKSVEAQRRQMPTVEKVVNPLGIVTTITAAMSAEVKMDMLDEVVSQLAAEEPVIHENCDETLFRPVVAIYGDDSEQQPSSLEEREKLQELLKPPEALDSKLVVPIIEKELDAELTKKEKQHNLSKMKAQIAAQRNSKKAQQKQQQQQGGGGSDDFEEVKLYSSDRDSNETKMSSQVSSIEKSKFMLPSFGKDKKKTASSMESDVVVAKPSMPVTAAVSKKPEVKPIKMEAIEVEFVAEKPLEFKRMTPLPPEKQTAIKKTIEISSPTKKKNDKNGNKNAKQEVKQPKVVEKDEKSLPAAVLKENKSKVENVKIEKSIKSEFSLSQETVKTSMELQTKPDVEKLLEVSKPEIELVKLLEPVELYTAPTQSVTKKNNSKKTKSSASSEEEGGNTNSHKTTTTTTLLPINVKDKDEIDSANNKKATAESELKKSTPSSSTKLIDFNAESAKNVAVKDKGNSKSANTDKADLKNDTMPISILSDFPLAEVKIIDIEPELKSASKLINIDTPSSDIKVKTGKQSNSPKSSPKKSHGNTEYKVVEMKIAQKETKLLSELIKETASKKDEVDNSKGKVSEKSEAEVKISANVEKKSTNNNNNNSYNNNNKKGKKSLPMSFEDFPLLKPLESLPPLPALEPLEPTLQESADNIADTVSLINFESPLQEDPLKVERKITPPPRGFTEQNLILALCGSLHYENETPDKAVDVDEELCPLIDGMSDSQAETTYTDTTPLTTLASMRSAAATPPSDSEGPMPATTSDDNVCILPTSPTAGTPHKLKTKKMEHKINLIAAIEAATSSSSTSSAEESGVEGGGRTGIEPDISFASVAATPIMPLTQNAAAAQQSATKKKTKRRKR